MIQPIEQASLVAVTAALLLGLVGYYISRMLLEIIRVHSARKYLVLVLMMALIYMQAIKMFFKSLYK